tara:strand:- start:345 stop:551 length:207 start_codon:yes stop_codon:yes gene_type:complete
MKVGDLVRMKTMMFWAAKNNKRFTYTDKPGVVIAIGVLGTPYEVITVLVGSTKYRGMASEWELVNEKR